MRDFRPPGWRKQEFTSLDVHIIYRMRADRTGVLSAKEELNPETRLKTWVPPAMRTWIGEGKTVEEEKCTTVYILFTQHAFVAEVKSDWESGLGGCLVLNITDVEISLKCIVPACQSSLMLHYFHVQWFVAFYPVVWFCDMITSIKLRGIKWEVLD